jgi:hypothetical protein
MVDPSTAVADVSLFPKLLPEAVSNAVLTAVGALGVIRELTIGASYVNTSCRVPVLADITTMSRALPCPLFAAQPRDVLLVHEVVEQIVKPSIALVVTSNIPKLVPLRVMKPLPD